MDFTQWVKAILHQTYYTKRGFSVSLKINVYFWVSPFLLMNFLNYAINLVSIKKRCLE